LPDRQSHAEVVDTEVVVRPEGVSIHLRAATPYLVADERRLFNALYNLVNNAIPEVQPEA
jgi:hypothetical protein